jgi:Leucine-rich repeat (LRR) protein
MTPEEAYEEVLRRIRVAKETGALELDLSRLALNRLPQLPASPRFYRSASPVLPAQRQLIPVGWPHIAPIAQPRRVQSAQRRSLPAGRPHLSPNARPLLCHQLRDLSPIAVLTSLQTLDLSWCNHLSDPSPLAGLISLQSLNLMGCNQLGDLTPLAT